MSEVTRICFVCLGNIVRSPLAENMFVRLAEEASVAHKYEVHSAGTSGYHVGESPDPRMRRVAARYGLRYDGQARKFIRKDFDNFDLIIAMSPNNRDDLLRIAPHDDSEDKIRLLRDFDPQGGSDASVPDPYYGGIEGFEEVYEIVERSCRGLLRVLEDNAIA